MKTEKELIAQAQAQINRVPIEKALEAVENADVVLDIREPYEFNSGHIPGAVNIPRGLLEFKLGELPQINSPQSKIIMYCKSGDRCALSALALKQMGYTEIYSLKGGLDAWIAAGYPIAFD